MTFQITLETENHEIIETISEGLLSLKFPRGDDPNYCCIKYIDPYMDMVFNRAQIDDLVKEITLWKSTLNDEQQNIFDSIIELAEKSKNDVHLYLKFWGD